MQIDTNGLTTPPCNTQFSTHNRSSTEQQKTTEVGIQSMASLKRHESSESKCQSPKKGSVIHLSDLEGMIEKSVQKGLKTIHADLFKAACIRYIRRKHLHRNASTSIHKLYNRIINQLTEEIGNSTVRLDLEVYGWDDIRTHSIIQDQWKIHMLDSNLTKEDLKEILHERH